MVWLGPLGPVDEHGKPITYPTVCPELTDEDVAWLNGQLQLVDRPTVAYLRDPPAGGGYWKGHRAGG